MARSRSSHEFLALQRRQLDAKLRRAASLRTVETPKRGWIRAIRTALGMSSAQLGKRLGMSSQGALDLERREARGTITVASLRKAAEALNCELVVALVPRTSLEETVREHARTRAAGERNRVVHTMRLEAQDEGVEAALDQRRSVESWVTTRIGRLWD